MENENVQTAAAPEPTVQLTMAQFRDMMAEGFRTLIKEMNLDKIDLRHGVFPGADNKEDLQKSAQERNQKFWRAMVVGDTRGAREISTRALTEGTANQGGELVPEEFQAEVIRLIPEYGSARRLCRVVSMSTDSKKFPKVTSTGITAYWPDEGGAITESQPVFGNVPLAAKKPAIIIPMTNEILDDTNLLIELLTQMAAEQLAYAEDYQFFQGAGSAPAITGVFKSTNVTRVIMSSGKTSLNDLTYRDILNMENGIAGIYLRGATWVMHRTAFVYVRDLKNDAGQHIFQNQTGTIDEFPYLKDEAAVNNPTTANRGQIALGDFKKSHIFADRKMMSVFMMREGTVGSNNLGEKDMSAFRFTERIDIQESNPTAAVVLWTAAS